MSYCATAQWWMEGKTHYTRSGFLKHSAHFLPDAIPADLTGTSIAVTGANSGLGLAVSKQLAKRNATVHMLCRNRERGQKALESIQQECTLATATTVQLHIVDISDVLSVQNFCHQFKTSGNRLNTLINNAGVVPETRMVTKDGNEVSFATMAGGSFLLTSLLLPVLQQEKHSRVINVSSAGMYTTKLDVDNIQCDQDKEYDGVFAYAHAKRAQVILTEMFQQKGGDNSSGGGGGGGGGGGDSGGSGGSKSASASVGGGAFPTFHSCHPGWSDTPGVQGKSMEWFNKQMQGNLRDPNEGGMDTVLWLAVGNDERLDTNGGHFWFDRNIARQHMTMAWTKESETERTALWTKLCEMFNHVPDL